jgi:WD40 repeat protein
LGSCCIDDATADPLAKDLALQTTKEGLGIARFAGNSQIEFVSLDGKATLRTIIVPGLDGLYDIQASTQVLLGSNRGLLSALSKDGIAAVLTSSVALFTLGGRQVKPTGLSTWPLLAVVSPKLDLLAVLAYSSPTRVSLRYGPLDWISTREVFTLDVGEGGTVNYHAESFSWSPDEQFLVYSLKGQVYVSDTTNGTRRSIAEGTDPCWSPDGESISYLSKNQDLMIYRLATGVSQRLTKSYTVVGYPKWSPDSQYVLFTRSSLILAIRNLLTMPTTEFMVIRVSDRAVASVYTPGGAMDNRRFFWVRADSKLTPPQH